MKGLLLKDFGLMKGQKRFFLVVILLAAVIGFGMEDPAFILGYMTFIIPMFVLSTISYDEYDNGCAFLFTLPITRKGYVLEKYCFALLLGAGALVAALILSLVIGSIQGAVEPKALLITAPVMLAAMLLFAAVLLPVQLKFGAEKGRIAMILVVGVVVLMGYLVKKFLDGSGVDPEVVFAKIQSVPTGALVAIAVVVLLLAFAVSILVSIRIMERKEF